MFYIFTEIKKPSHATYEDMKRQDIFCPPEEIIFIIVNENFEEVDKARFKYTGSYDMTGVLSQVEYDYLLGISEFVKKYSSVVKDGTFGTYNTAIMGGHNVSSYHLPVLLEVYNKFNNLAKGQYDYLKIHFSWFPVLDSIHLISTLGAVEKTVYKEYALAEVAKAYQIAFDKDDIESMAYASLEVYKRPIKTLQALISQETA